MGATANAVVRNLLTYRNKVIVVPSGNYGFIVDVVKRNTGNQQVFDTDNRNLV
jgi:aspartate aminotransferase-like enzyme